MSKKILIIGSSSGIGKSLTEYFTKQGFEVIGVSRRESKNCNWIKADISTQEGISNVLRELDDKVIDLMVFCSGIWEDYGFMDEFDFLKTSSKETENIMKVNLIAPIELTKGLSSNFSLSENPRAIYLGAICGVDNLATEQVAYNASKFGLRGAIQSLRVALKDLNIGFTVINPGNVGTDEVLEDIREGRFDDQVPIAIDDIISTIEFITELSSNVEVADINLIQKESFNCK